MGKTPVVAVHCVVFAVAEEHLEVFVLGEESL